MNTAKIMQFLVDNWYFVALVIISEAMPFLPTRANGIAQGLLNALKRIKAGPVALLYILSILLIPVLFCGCTTISVTVTPGGGDKGCQVTISADKNINTNTLPIQGNTIPQSAITGAATGGLGALIPAVQ